MAQLWIADFAEFVLIVSGRKPANAPETALWETSARVCAAAQLAF
jgi:hypothetical protein